MILFLCSFGVSLGRYCQESVVKSWMFGENIKGGVAVLGGCLWKGGSKLLHTMKAKIVVINTEMITEITYLISKLNLQMHTYYYFILNMITSTSNQQFWISTLSMSVIESDNLWFSGVFREYKIGTLARSKLKNK